MYCPMAGATDSCISEVHICSHCMYGIIMICSFSHLKDSLILINFLMTVGKKYADSYRASKFISDLLKLDVPELFHHSKIIRQSFCQELQMYIRNHSLRSSFLKNFIQIMVSPSLLRPLLNNRPVACKHRGI